jgi:hypothetical protein
VTQAPRPSGRSPEGERFQPPRGQVLDEANGSASRRRRRVARLCSAGAGEPEQLGVGRDRPRHACRRPRELRDHLPAAAAAHRAGARDRDRRDRPCAPSAPTASTSGAHACTGSGPATGAGAVIDPGRRNDRGHRSVADRATGRGRSAGRVRGRREADRRRHTGTVRSTRRSRHRHARRGHASARRGRDAFRRRHLRRGLERHHGERARRGADPAAGTARCGTGDESTRTATNRPAGARPHLRVAAGAVPAAPTNRARPPVRSRSPVSTLPSSVTSASTPRRRSSSRNCARRDSNRRATPGPRSSPACSGCGSPTPRIR